MAHLFVDISAHGLGHLAQTAPILNQLQRMDPGLRLTLRSGLPLARLRQRITAPFEFIGGEPDFGFVMRNALEIDLPASAARYRQRHQDWPQTVAAEANFLHHLKPDLVLSNVAYLPLAGAARAGIPAVAMCCLNWADLFDHYFGEQPWATEIYAEMLGAYCGAATFLRVSPGMPMPALVNLRAIGPLAAVQPRQRAAIAAILGIPSTERWVLIGLGGIEHRLPVETWPRLAGVRWLVPEAWQIIRSDVGSYPQQVGFVDLLASADALVTKTGYGSLIEATCHGIPVLYLRRQDWPEEPWLIEWLSIHNRASELAPDEARSGLFAHRLGTLWNTMPPAPPRPCGIDTACACIVGLLPVTH